MSRQCSIGLLVREQPEEIVVTLGDAENWGYDFIVVPISRPSFEHALDRMNLKEYEIWKDRPSFDRNDLNLTLAEHTRKVLGLHSSWFELESPVDNIRIRSELAFRQEVEWITHINLTGAIFPMLCPQVENTARVLNSVLTPKSPQICVRVRLSENGRHWKRWNKLRVMTKHNPKLGVALEVTPHLPVDTLDLWLAEPVRALILPASIFVENAFGHPVMTKPYQEFVKKMMHFLGPDIILTQLRPDQAEDHCKYIRFLNRNLPKLTHIEKTAWEFSDFLQIPLQPLADHLKDHFYKVFEKDPVKYKQYEEAIYQALLNRVENLSDVVTTVMVAGAGRGPLVNCCLRAADRSKRKIHIYAIEKNPHAYVTLQNEKANTWGDKVSLVFSDMRTWKSDIKCDILVSELLGSFGDNELSPECLDGAQKLLKEDGISIPASYTTSIAPLSSNRIYTNIMDRKDPSSFETPYVIMFQQVCLLDSPQGLWAFHHPNRKDIPLDKDPINNLHNTRYSQVQFRVKHDCMIHGVSGYFDCVLYRDVTVSIHPETHSPGMFSWFPIFFPLQNPVQLSPGSVITLHFWRLTRKKKVWYEWSMGVKNKEGNEVYVSIIHNTEGKSYSIGL